jgi:hypothetical protein
MSRPAAPVSVASLHPGTHLQLVEEDLPNRVDLLLASFGQRLLTPISEWWVQLWTVIGALAEAVGDGVKIPHSSPHPCSNQ